MSYDIMYDRQCVNVNGKVIMMLLSGDNRTTTFSYSGREKRLREWWMYNPAGEAFMVTPAEFMDVIRRLFNDPQHQRFMYSGKFLYDSDVVRFFEKSIKDALTIEEMNIQGAFVSLHARLYGWKKADKDAWHKPVFDDYLHTTDEIEEWVKKAEAKKAEWEATGECDAADISMMFDGDEPLRLISSKIMHNPVAVKHKSTYVCAYTDNSVSFSADPTKAIIFDDVADARAKLPSWRTFNDMRFVKPPKISATPKQQYILKLDDSVGGSIYVYRLSRNKIRFYSFATDNCKRFPSEKAAVKWFNEHISGRFDNRFSNPVAIPAPAKIAI